MKEAQQCARALKKAGVSIKAVDSLEAFVAAHHGVQEEIQALKDKVWVCSQCRRLWQGQIAGCYQCALVASQTGVMHAISVAVCCQGRGLNLCAPACSTTLPSPYLRVPIPIHLQTLMRDAGEGVD